MPTGSKCRALGLRGLVSIFNPVRLLAVARGKLEFRLSSLIISTVYVVSWPAHLLRSVFTGLSTIMLEWVERLCLCMSKAKPQILRLLDKIKN